MASRSALDGTRRELALALSDGRRTAHELSRIVGRPTGSFLGVLKRMHADELVAIDSAEPGRGTHYWLTALGEAELDRPSGNSAEAGALVRGQFLLQVLAPDDRRPIDREIARRRLSGNVIWMAEIGPDWFLALDPAVTDPWVLDQLQGALRDHGVASRVVAVTRVTSGDEMRRRSDDLLHPLAPNAGTRHD